MCSCDFLFNPILKDVVHSITKKLGYYALATLPLISAKECQEYCDLVDEYHCGFNCEAGEV